MKRAGVRKDPGSDHDPSEDFTSICSAELPPLLPEGEYESVFQRVEKKMLSGRMKLFLWFRVVSHGEWFGQEVYIPCNYPRRITPALKYYKMWVIAEGRRPKRNDRMSVSVFKNKAFLVRIRTVRKNWKQQALTPELQYSVGDDIIKKIAGS